MRYSVITGEFNRIDYICWYKYKTPISHQEDDLPAIEWSNGDFEYFSHGKRHRTNGPALKHSIYSPNNPTIIYYLNNKEIKVSSDDEFFQYQKLMTFQ